MSCITKPYIRIDPKIREKDLRKVKKFGFQNAIWKSPETLTAADPSKLVVSDKLYS